MSVCVTHIQNEPLSTVRWGDERWTEASRTPLAYSLPPSFLSLVSLPVFHSLPCSLPCWAVNLTDVENKQKKKKKFVNINNVSPRLSVFACAWEQEGGVRPHLCVLWAACDVWSRIHLVHLHFVCLPQPSICCWGESWVWWSGQMAAARLLVWILTR